MLWEFLAILAACFWAVGNLVDKIIVSKIIKQPMTAVIMLGIISLLSFSAILISGRLTWFGWPQALLGLTAGICYTLMNVCYIKAVQLEEISKIIPLFALSPIMVALGAGIVLHEVFSSQTYLAIALILIGAVVLSANKFERFKLNQAFWLMVGASASIAITEVIQKYLLHGHPFWSVFAYSRLGSGLAILPIAWLYRDEFLGLIKNHKVKSVGFLSLSSLLNIMGILTVVIASSQGFVTLVNALTQVQPLIVLILTMIASFIIPHIIQEEQGIKIFVRKFGSIAAMFIGVILIG